MFGRLVALHIPKTNNTRRLSVCQRIAKPEIWLLLIGVWLLAIYCGAVLHSFVFSQIGLWEFDVAQANAATGESWLAEAGNIDFRLWDKTRIKAYRASLALRLAPPIAVLNIHEISLRVPVFDGIDDVTLNRGVGRVRGTAMPGSPGNLAIAGHRDGFFRGLKDVQIGDLIEITIPNEKDTYVVDATTIVNPRDVSVLEPQPVPSLTLITCYPFYFIGDAPQRFVVRASLKERDLLQQQEHSGPSQK
jgi:sortase A